MPKFFWFLLSFLIVTGPGALDSWLSIGERIAGNNESRVNIYLGDWYQSLFPIFGFAILAFGIWWTRSKHETHKQTDTAGSTSVASKSESECSDGNVGQDHTNGISAEKHLNKSPVIIEASPSALVGIYKNRTKVEAAPIVATYIGRKLIVKAKVFDVDTETSGDHEHRISLKDGNSEPFVFARFTADWNGVISNIRKNQEITVLGSITNITDLWVHLESCSLIDDLKNL